MSSGKDVSRWYCHHRPSLSSLCDIESVEEPTRRFATMVRGHDVNNNDCGRNAGDDFEFFVSSNDGSDGARPLVPYSVAHSRADSERWRLFTIVSRYVVRAAFLPVT